MATSKKLTELDALTTAANTDILYIVDDPTGSAVSKKITVENVLQSNVSANFAIDGNIEASGTVTGNVVISTYASTPADSNSAPAFANGAMWTDGSYLYVVTDSTSNEVKRVTLTTF